LGDGVIRFRDQVGYHSQNELRVASKPSPSVELGNATLCDPRNGQQYEVTYTVQLLTDAPA